MSSSRMCGDVRHNAGARASWVGLRRVALFLGCAALLASAVSCYASKSCPESTGAPSRGDMPSASASGYSAPMTSASQRVVGISDAERDRREEESFRRDPLDPTVGGEREALLRKAVASTTLRGTTVESIVCHANICRLDFSFTAEAAEHDLPRLFSPGGSLTVAVRTPGSQSGSVHSKEGGRRVVIYLGFYPPLAQTSPAR